MYSHIFNTVGHNLFCNLFLFDCFLTTDSSLVEANDENCTGVAAALGTLLAILVIGLVISLTVNVIQFVQGKKARLCLVAVTSSL